MFEFNPDLIAGDDDEASTEQYKPEPEEVSSQVIVKPDKKMLIFVIIWLSCNCINILSHI